MKIIDPTAVYNVRKDDFRHRRPLVRRVELPAKQLMGFTVQTSRNGVPVMRFFSDKQLEGRRKAFEAAQQFAADLEDGSEMRALLHRLKPRKNTRSGTPGVARYEGGGKRGPFWVAYWDENERKVQRRFSIVVFGEEQARALAFEARRQAVRQHVKRLRELRRQNTHLLSSVPQPH